ncbi:MAG: phosphate uptake regulator PhoU [Nanoarchaeota archaeon]|nr:phosphate uptake regulator PhoU [Nanoarchaeota archaeon]
MKRYKRKLQFVAGSTYSVSLPKEWVKTLNLSQKQEINLVQQEDMSLVLSPAHIKEVDKSFIEICIDGFSEKIRQIMYSIYYEGYDELVLFSKSKIPQSSKKIIREVIYDLSGTEIIYEDDKKVRIKIMLGELNLDVFHIIYRMNLLISSSLESICSNLDWREIKFNEDEVDRLYNLATRIIENALTNGNILNSSGVKNIKLIPYFFLILKRLENVSDDVKNLGNIVRKNKQFVKEIRNSLLELNKHLNYSISHLRNPKDKNYSLFSKKEEFEKKFSSMKEVSISKSLEAILKNIINIQEEIIIIDFYKKMI